jgi:hypothetical protein
MKDSNGWDEYKHLVINELERNSTRLDTIEKRLGKIEGKLGVLDTKIYMAVFVASIFVGSIVNVAWELLQT